MIKEKKIYSCDICGREFNQGYNFLEISLDGHDGAQIGFINDDEQFYIEDNRHYCNFNCFIIDLKTSLNIA